MGLGNSKTEKAIGDLSDSTERYFGFDNVHRDVLQALYFCVPFRMKVLEYYEYRTGATVIHRAGKRPMIATVADTQDTGASGGADLDLSSTSSTSTSTSATADHHGTSTSVMNGSAMQSGGGGGSPPQRHLLMTLAELFVTIYQQKKRTGSHGPKAFIEHLRKENELFRSMMQQDAHEFLLFLLNHIAEILQREQMQILLQRGRFKGMSRQDLMQQQRKIKTFVHEIFEGTLTTETRCIECEEVTRRNECFLDLSLDVSQNSSITHCLNNFSSIETLKGSNKFYCDHCNSYQEAHKKMKLKGPLPTVLILHLKRFKYSEEIQEYRKLPHRVPFPCELRISCTMDNSRDNTCSDGDNNNAGLNGGNVMDESIDESRNDDCGIPQEYQEVDKLYRLFAVVIHVGSGPNTGHYKTLIKSEGSWFIFDDSIVDIVSDKYVQNVFGYSNDAYAGTSSTGYILYYY